MLELTQKEKICLEVLEETCKKYEMENDYSVGMPVEQKLCIIKREDGWQVFIVERGQELDKTKHKKCIDACLEVISQCSYCIDEFKDASAEFKNILLSKVNVNNCKKK